MPKLDLPPRIVSLVARCDRQDLADKLIGLSLLPEFQANYPRILTLLHLALARARGARRTSVSELASLLNGLDGHDIGRSEDPAEDVFVSNVATFGGNYRIFNGVFTASAFSLERLLDAVFGGDFPARELLWAQCHALLILSDAIAERRGLNANDYAESVPRQSRWPLRLQAHLRSCRNALTAMHGAERGLSIVIYDSPGWSVEFDAGEAPGTDWFVVALSAYSFSTLLADPRFTLLDLWKLLRAERDLETSGIRLVVWPDPLNRWAIWRDWGFSFRPRDLDLRGFGSILADTSQIQKQVVLSRSVAQSHSAPTPSGGWQAVERIVRGDSPSGEVEKPVFLAALSAARGVMHAAVETGHGAWWVTMARPPFDRAEYSYLFLLWQSATEWLLRLAASAGDRLIWPADAIEISLLPVPASIADAPDAIEYVVHDSMAVVRVVLPSSLIDAMATADNRGERILVRALAEAVALAHNISMASADLEAWADEVTADPALKMMHVTTADDAGLVLDHLTERRPCRQLQAPDIAAASGGMRDRLAGQVDSVVTPEMEAVDGEELVGDVLRAAVDARWRRCRDRLEQLDRAATLRLIARMIEAVHRDRVNGERSALARTRLYAESSDLEAWSIGSMSRRDETFRAYRVAAEMAVCASPLTGGRLPGVSDIDQVAAEIAYLIRNADDSDAVRFGLIEPKLRFTPNGSLEMEKGGANAFTQDYLKACLHARRAKSPTGSRTIMARPTTSSTAT